MTDESSVTDFLCVADDQAGQEDQRSANDDLHGRREKWRVHVAMSDVADRGQLRRDDRGGGRHGDPEVRNEEGQGVTQTPSRSHEPAYEAANPWMSSSRERPIVR